MLLVLAVAVCNAEVSSAKDGSETQIIFFVLFEMFKPNAAFALEALQPFCFVFVFPRTDMSGVTFAQQLCSQMS